MTKRVWVLIGGLLVLAPFLAAPRLAAQGEAAESPAEKEAADETGTDDAAAALPESAGPTTEEEPQTIDDLDSFVPSEEVSSDLSISFPVDI